MWLGTQAGRLWLLGPSCWYRRVVSYLSYWDQVERNLGSGQLHIGVPCPDQSLILDVHHEVEVL